MPPTKLPDPETWNLVAFIHALIGPASENNVPGNPEAGRQIYHGAAAACADCHAIRGAGGRLGPDLTNIGSRPLALIRDSILKRSKDLYLLGNESVTVRLNNGQSIEGVARNRDNYSIQVVDKQGNLHLLSMLDVKQLTISPRSAMPTDYGQRLSKQELEDLLAFLAHQTIRGKN